MQSIKAVVERNFNLPLSSKSKKIVPVNKKLSPMNTIDLATLLQENNETMEVKNLFFFE